MAKLRDLYDDEVIANITNAYGAKDEEEDNGEPKTDPFTDITPYEPPHIHNGVPFSTAFGWNPKTIPNINVPLFSDEDWPEPARVMIPDCDPDWIWNRELCEQMALAFADG